MDKTVVFTDSAANEKAAKWKDIEAGLKRFLATADSSVATEEGMEEGEEEESVPEDSLLKGIDTAHG